MQSPPFWTKHSYELLAGLLLLVLAVELGFSVRRQSQTYDEATYIHAGYRYWQCGDFGVNTEHPPLSKLVATIPLLFDQPKNPGPPCASYDTGTEEDFAHGTDFLYSNDAGRILAETRFFAASFTVLLAVFVFLAARTMFGMGTAIMALLLLVFEPNILAHGALVTNDLPVTCWFFASVYAFYRYLQRPTTLGMIVCGVSAGFALATKNSSLLLPPILTMLVVAEGWIVWRASSPATLADRGKFWKRLARGFVALAMIAVIAAAILWGFYRFRYSARPAGHEMSVSLSRNLNGVPGRVMGRVIPRLRYVMPESYVYGLADNAKDSTWGIETFLLGRLYPTGLWFYFPVAFVIKCTLGFLLLLLLTIFTGRDLWREKKREITFLIIPALSFFGVSLTSHLDLGIRYLLPVFPFLIVLVAAGVLRFARQRRSWAYLAAALVAFHCISSLRAFPNYLAYSNEAWGGPQQTYRYLTDSNVDWGRGLIDVRDYLARHHITDCWLAYNATADPDYYDIPCKSLPDVVPHKRAAVVPRPVEGTLLISASDLSGFAFWGSPDMNPFAPLLHVKPAANLGGHTLVFQGSFDLRLLSAASHSRQAEILASQGQLQAALAEARAAVEMAPERMQGHLTLAQLLAQAKQLPEARSEYQESIRLAEAEGTGYYRPQFHVARSGLAALDSAR